MKYLLIILILCCASLGKYNTYNVLAQSNDFNQYMFNLDCTNMIVNATNFSFVVIDPSIENSKWLTSEEKTEFSKRLTDVEVVRNFSSKLDLQNSIILEAKCLIASRILLEMERILEEMNTKLKLLDKRE